MQFSIFLSHVSFLFQQYKLMQSDWNSFVVISTYIALARHSGSMTAFYTKHTKSNMYVEIFTSRILIFYIFFFCMDAMLTLSETKSLQKLFWCYHILVRSINFFIFCMFLFPLLFDICF